MKTLQFGAIIGLALLISCSAPETSNAEVDRYKADLARISTFEYERDIWIATESAVAACMKAEGIEYEQAPPPPRMDVPQPGSLVPYPGTDLTYGGLFDLSGEIEPPEPSSPEPYQLTDIEYDVLFGSPSSEGCLMKAMDDPDLVDQTDVRVHVMDVEEELALLINAESEFVEVDRDWVRCIMKEGHDPMDRQSFVLDLLEVKDHRLIMEMARLDSACLESTGFKLTVSKLREKLLPLVLGKDQ